MNNNLYKSIIEKSQVAYACHRIICAEAGPAWDYEFVEVNSAFESIIGLKRSELIGKKITDLSPHIIKDTFEWVKYYGEIALNGGQKEFELFSELLNKWYRVTVYSPEKAHIAAHFVDISKQRELFLELKDTNDNKEKEAEDQEKVIQTIDESTKTLSPWMCEYRVQLPGESVKWILGNSIPKKSLMALLFGAAMIRTLPSVSIWKRSYLMKRNYLKRHYCRLVTALFRPIIKAMC